MRLVPVLTSAGHRVWINPRHVVKITPWFEIDKGVVTTTVLGSVITLTSRRQMATGNDKLWSPADAADLAQRLAVAETSLGDV